MPAGDWRVCAPALLVALLAAAGCGRPAPGGGPSRPAPGPSAGSPTAEPVHIETNGQGGRYTTIVQREPDRRTGRSRIAYRLRADSSQAVVAGNGSTASFVRPHISFYAPDGKPLVADSPQAKVTERDKAVVMSGGVRARAADGSVLTCDVLRYDGRSDRIFGNGHVALSTPGGLTLTGRYLVGDVRLEHVRIAQHPL